MESRLSRNGRLSMNSINTLLFSFFSLFLPQTAVADQSAINVVFDLGGVVVGTKTVTAMEKVGFLNLLFYGGNPRNIYFSYLDSIIPRTADTPAACDEHGTALPQLMCDWMLGTKTRAEIFDIINRALVRDTLLKYREYNVIEGMASMMFGGIDEYIATKQIFPKAYDFIRECKAKGYKLYVLSNWDAESFAVLKKMYPDLFNLFDGIVVSGEVGLMKPDPAIYQYLLETFDLDPDYTIFIDDQEENKEAAEQAGIHTILCPQTRKFITKKPDFDKVRTEFNRWLDAVTKARTA